MSTPESPSMRLPNGSEALIYLTSMRLLLHRLT
jgi:hypothetical protein